MNVQERLAKNLAWLKDQDIFVQQQPEEIAKTYEYLAIRKPAAVLVEIGVYRGGSLLLLAEFVEPGGLVIGIDTFEGNPHQQPTGLTWAEKVKDELTKRNLTAILIKGSSHAVVPEVKTAVGERGIDHLHIDGAHNYESVSEDYRDYAPLVNSGGLIQMHDVLNNRPGMGVVALWSEVAEQYPGATRLGRAAHEVSVGMLPVP